MRLFSYQRVDPFVERQSTSCQLIRLHCSLFGIVFRAFGNSCHLFFGPVIALLRYTSHILSFSWKSDCLGAICSLVDTIIVVSWRAELAVMVKIEARRAADTSFTVATWEEEEMEEVKDEGVTIDNRQLSNFR